MSIHRLHGATLSSAIALVLASAFASTAVDAATESAPRLQATGSGVQLTPAIHAPAWQLRVAAPDGRIFEDTLLDGEQMLVSPQKFGQPRWKDGVYQYELVPVLGDRVRADSEAANAPKAGVELARSGTFAVVGGVVRLPGAEAEIVQKPTPVVRAATGTVAPSGMVTPADQVVPDDMIVQSSLCVGFDCVDGESFGTDTIRMKENNTRIKFDDTSTSAGFAANDWQLTANDQPSGGANKFSIDDITNARTPFTITAAAPSNALFIASTGKVGFRTATPGLDLHMQTTDTPAIRFEQTSAGGYTAQTWDIGANEANFFIRDLTGGSKLSLRIRPGAPTSSLDIAASGNVGVGTASPSSALHVARSGNVGLRLQNTSGANANWELFSNAVSGRLNITDDPTYARTPIKISTGAVDNLMRIGAPTSSTIEVNGTLKVNGDIQVSGSVGPDYVFAPGYALPSIAEHAEYMQTNRHLPKVGPAVVDVGGRGVMSLGTLSHGMLEELEVAHLYIADLDRTVDELQLQLDARDAELEAMRAEMSEIRAAIDER
jgi:hypothetical protein